MHLLWLFDAPGVFLFGYLLTLLLIPLVLLKGDRPPVSTVAWMMSIVFLPYLGSLLFLLFGLTRIHRHARKRRLYREQSRWRSGFEERSEADVPMAPLCRRLAVLGERLGGGPVLPGNSVQPLPESESAFAAMEAAIVAARERLNVQYYIWRPDTIGTRLRDRLIEKAREGVAVRFIYDGIGSLWLNGRFLKPMRDAGIRATPFLPGRTLRERWSLNLRNHRKMLVVDGRTAFTGGLNVGDEYLGKVPAWGYWRDTHVRLDGPVVSQLDEVFAEDWYYATGEQLATSPRMAGPGEAGPSGKGLPAQVIADGPDHEPRVLQTLLLAAVMDAERSVTLSTGYFVPPAPLHAALQTAAYRGVRVRLMLAGPSTYWYTLLAGRSYYEPLLDAGVEILEYQKGLFHAKVVTVDGCWSLVGTPNLDVRSLKLNFEVAVAICDSGLASELERQFERDTNHARRIDPREWKQRSGWEVRRENFCRLFAPLL